MLEQHWNNTFRQRNCFRTLGTVVRHFCSNISVLADKSQLTRDSFSPQKFSPAPKIIQGYHLCSKYVCWINMQNWTFHDSQHNIKPESQPWHLSLFRYTKSYKSVEILLHLYWWNLSSFGALLGFEHCPPHYYNCHPPGLPTEIQFDSNSFFCSGARMQAIFRAFLDML